jgi:Tfp pilus assembly protein PilX
MSLQKQKQRGSSLIVALVMLVVLTLLVISALRSGNANLRIAGNMQTQGEATAAAQQAIEQVISSNFTTAPVSSVVLVDINNDAKADYDVSVAVPTCTGSVALMNANLNMSNPNDVPCFSSSTTSNTGIMSASGVPVTTGQSWCYSQQWDVQTQATSRSGSGANVTIHQGISLRVPAGTTC